MRQPLAFALALSVVACANPIESMILTEDTALISAVGSSKDDPGRVIDASLREAARFTAARGFRYFVVLDSADASRAGREVPLRRNNQERMFAEPVGRNGPLITAPVYRSFFTPVGPTVPTLRPGIDITIRMYRDGEVDPKLPGVWGATELLTDESVVLPALP